MTNRRLLLLGLGWLMLLSPPAAWTEAAPKASQPADADQEPLVTPTISLNAYGRTTLQHDAKEPLLLEVSLGNPRAAEVKNENRKRRLLREAHKRSPEWKKMSKEERKTIEEPLKPLLLPIFTLGSKDQGVWQLLSFTVTDASGKEVFWRIRPLAPTAAQHGAIQLDDEASTSLLFGIDPSALTEVPKGTYRLQAAYDSRRAQGMWRGRVATSIVAVTLADGDGLSGREALRRTYAYGRFYLLDQQYDQVERYAKNLLARDATSAEAWELRGDALAGQGNFDEAINVFQQLVNLFNDPAYKAKFAKDEQHAGRIEPPEYAMRRIRELKQEQAATRSR